MHNSLVGRYVGTNFLRIDVFFRFWVAKHREFITRPDSVSGHTLLYSASNLVFRPQIAFLLGFGDQVSIQGLIMEVTRASVVGLQLLIFDSIFVSRAKNEKLRNPDG